MSEYCKGCGVKLQNEDPKALGYTPSLDADYCQRCYRLRHYGDVTINMQQGIAAEETLKKSMNSTASYSGPSICSISKAI
ncbi:hypothetical protein [Allobaculum sp. Allo2]|uniref:hypothetical protein n=1 Tax=Allobaculum sp. Allo2 TaxID=2853432 RepID=UPI001F600CAB|nr:hypothetical protein [Allobaculum sp. Allo2]UNT93400.1 hypothetical protein KWG61_00750 [Allobaculum sp. Allo2]